MIENIPTWIPIVGWVIGSIWASRHYLNWFSMTDELVPPMDADDVMLLILMGFLTLMLGGMSWPLVLLFVIARKLLQISGFSGSGLRWLEWFFATTREGRKEALRK